MQSMLQLLHSQLKLARSSAGISTSESVLPSEWMPLMVMWVLVSTPSSTVISRTSQGTKLQIFFSLVPFELT